MAWYSRIANVFRGDRHARAVRDEVDFHLAERTDELTASGMTVDEARHEARRRFGNAAAHAEDTRDADLARALETVLRDVRHGLRQLRMNRGFAAVAVVSLALGIGATSAMFQLIDALRMRALPVRDAEALVTVTKAPDFYTAGFYSARNTAFTYAQFEQIGRHQQAFAGLMAFGTSRFNLSTGGEARYAEGLYLTPNALDVLGVPPWLGSGFDAAADPRDCSNAGVLLNHTFWTREFGGDRSAIGRTLTLDGRSFPVVGVAPPAFFGVEPGFRFDVAMPVCADTLFGGDRLSNKTAWWLTPIGRLRPGWSLERASGHLRDLSPAVFRESLPESYRPDAQAEYLENTLSAASARAGVSDLRSTYAQPLWIMFAIAGLVLLIACANLANLLLARASARQREMNLRLAIGASRRRLLRQLMTESLLLAALGTVLGAAFAHALGRSLILFLDTGGSPVHLPLAVDWHVVTFTGVLGVSACLLFGLAPALRATGRAPANALRHGRGSAGQAEGHRVRRALVVAQVGVSFVLLVGALLFGQSLQHLLTTETGLVTDRVLLAVVRTNSDPERRLGEFHELENRVQRLPDVASASSVLFAPFGGGGWNEHAFADGTTGSDRPLVWFNRITPGYFATLGTTLLTGRDIDAHDDGRAPGVAVVNEQFARRVFGGADPVGRLFRTEAAAGESDPIYRVIGLVRDTKYSQLQEEPRAIAFLALAQDTRPPDRVNVVIRARGGFASIQAGVQREMAAINPRLLVEFAPLDRQLVQSVQRERLLAGVSGGFGAVAVALSTLGLYGVMSYLVSMRRNEIGVRLALGASRTDIFGQVFAETGRLLAAGLGLGTLAALALSRYAESLLYGLTARDTTTMVLGGVLLIATALTAVLVPARRAASLDPAVTLRSD